VNDMDTATAITVDDLAAARRATNRAEADQLRLMFAFHSQRKEAAQHEVTPVARLLACKMIAQEIGEAMGLSENQVRTMMHDAETVRDRAPATWLRFTVGSISFHAVKAIAATINKLTEPESVTELDAKVGEYAEANTVGQLNVWLRRFVVRVEAEAAAARAEHERSKRYVYVDHGDDGMSTIVAYLPSYVAAAIERRLHKEARKLPKDGRTLEQKQADLFACWLTTNENTGRAAVNADIGVVIDADVLAGAREGFGASPDGSWVAPAAWVADVAMSDEPFWFRMLRDPVTKDILSVDYRSRFAPEQLKRALFLARGTCAVPGCLVPGWKCEVDHVVPWPRGHTTADNLQFLSKTHHGQKGHGLSPLRRSRRPGRPRAPVDLMFDPVDAGYDLAA